jgi:protein-disulfide isomerase
MRGQIAEERPLNITRRRFCEGLAFTALSSLMLGSASVTALLRPALAQAPEPSMTDLLTPPPLGDRQLGPDNAPVTIIEYASLTCPHCAHFENTTFPDLKKRYIDTGKVRYIFREFALNPLDMGAIMLARCIDKDKYFPFVETLFAKQDAWVVQKPIEPLFRIAQQAGFTRASFEACLKNQQIMDGIEKERTRASEKFGVNSTPTFFVNGKVLRGAMSIEDLEKEIKPFLNEK